MRITAKTEPAYPYTLRLWIGLNGLWEICAILPLHVAEDFVEELERLNKLDSGERD